MKTIDFLEKIANHSHYNTAINELMATQPGSIKDAFMSNDSESLKNQISSVKFFANDCLVVG